MAISTSRHRPRGFLARHPEWVLLGLLTFCMIGAGFTLFAIESHRPFASTSSERELRVWFLDIGQGDAIFIETPEGHQILIDGGPDDAVLAKLGQIMMPWDRAIDMIVVTHPHTDHFAGLTNVLARYEVGEIVVNAEFKDTSAIAAFEEARQHEPAQTTIVRAGQAWTFGDVVMEAIWPISDADVEHEDPNYASVVFLLTYKDTTVLFTGDSTSESERLYASYAGDVDVLKAGHHGSSTSTSEFLLDTISPEIVTISCGEGNRYGHPHPATLTRLSEHNIATYRTDLDGDLLLLSNGGEPTVVPAPLPF